MKSNEPNIEINKQNKDALLLTLTGAEHVYLYGALLGLSGAHLVDFCEMFFEEINCKEYMHRLVRTYSGGTKRKLSLGLALIGNVHLLLLDEPTSGVDPESRQALWHMIERAKRKNKGIMLASHSMEECEVLGDKVGIIYKGEMLCIASPAEIRAAFGQRYQIECVFFAADVASNPSLPHFFINTLKNKFNSLKIIHKMNYRMVLAVEKQDATLAKIFCEIEKAKVRYLLLFICLSTISLFI